MNGAKLFKKFLMPCGLCAAVPVIKKDDPTPRQVSNKNEEQKKLIRPSELPIYTCESTRVERDIPCEPKPGPLEDGFRTVRETIQGYVKQVSGYTDVISNTINTGYAHTQGVITVTLDYLREEKNVLPRAGSIGLGGLSGLILGLRGGKFKKIVYTSTGALVVASICYPAQAAEGLQIAKHYVNIGYNFLYGIKPGENQMEIKWPELPKVPTNVSEVKDLIGSAVGSAASGVGTLAKTAIQKFKEFSETPLPPGESKPKTE